MNKSEIIKKMTIEEKASFLSGRDFWSTTEYEKYGIPSMFLSDGPHGVRKQASASDHLGLNASIARPVIPLRLRWRTVGIRRWASVWAKDSARKPRRSG